MRKVKFLEEIKIKREAEADFNPLKHVQKSPVTDPIRSKFSHFAHLQTKHRKDFF